MADEDVELVMDETRESMDKALKSLRHDLLSVRTGRASTTLVDGLQIDYYGAQTPLNQLANLSTPDPRLLVISPFDKASIQAIERAKDAGLEPLAAICLVDREEGGREAIEQIGCGFASIFTLRELLDG